MRSDRLSLHRAAVIASTLTSSVAIASAPLPPPPIFCDPFIVPFDWNSAEIPARSESILENVVLACAQNECPQIRLSAHADSSGSRTYNVQLSRRRAHAIERFLEQRGLRTPITIEIIGEERLVRDTADGVREPLNRFVAVDSCPGADAPGGETADGKPR